MPGGKAAKPEVRADARDDNVVLVGRLAEHCEPRERDRIIVRCAERQPGLYALRGAVNDHALRSAMRIPNIGPC
jgi:hypothetical protein